MDDSRFRGVRRFSSENAKLASARRPGSRNEPPENGFFPGHWPQLESSGTARGQSMCFGNRPSTAQWLRSPSGLVSPRPLDSRRPPLECQGCLGNNIQLKDADNVSGKYTGSLKETFNCNGLKRCVLIYDIADGPRFSHRVS